MLALSLKPQVLPTSSTSTLPPAAWAAPLIAMDDARANPAAAMNSLNFIWSPQKLGRSNDHRQSHGFPEVKTEDTSQGSFARQGSLARNVPSPTHEQGAWNGQSPPTPEGDRFGVRLG